jgi:hypothetical protein
MSELRDLDVASVDVEVDEGDVVFLELLEVFVKARSSVLMLSR